MPYRENRGVGGLATVRRGGLATRHALATGVLGRSRYDVEVRPT